MALNAGALLLRFIQKFVLVLIYSSRSPPHLRLDGRSLG